MQTDPNHYREYICNIQTPKMKAREVRVTKDLQVGRDLQVAGVIEVDGDLDVRNGDILTTGQISCSKLIASSSIVSNDMTTNSLSTYHIDTGTIAASSSVASNDMTTNTLSSYHINTGTITANQSVTLSGGLTVTGTTRINSDTTTICPFDSTTSETPTKLKIYSRAPEVGTERSYVSIGPTGGVTDFNSVVEGSNIACPISLKVQNNEVASFSDVNILLKEDVTIQKRLFVKVPYYGYDDPTNAPVAMTQQGFRIEEPTQTVTFPALGNAWVTAHNLTLGIGVWMVYGQLNIKCTPSNFCDVNKWGIQILSPWASSVALSEDRTNIGKAISDNTSFTINTMGTVVVSTPGNFFLQGYIAHTGTNTNVYSPGQIPYSIFGAVRIA